MQKCSYTKCKECFPLKATSPRGHQSRWWMRLQYLNILAIVSNVEDLYGHLLTTHVTLKQYIPVYIKVDLQWDTDLFPYTHSHACAHTRHSVRVYVCSWTASDAGAEVTAGHCWHQVRQQISSGCTTQYFGFIMQQMLECAIQVAKADKLNSSYLAQGTSLSCVSGTMCPFVSSAQAPLLNPFVFGVFFLYICFGFYYAEYVSSSHERSTPIFNNNA